MQDQKLENLLNLSLEATPQERQKSTELNTGYNPVANAWDLIVRYTGDIKRIENESIRVVVLTNNYAIITVPENLIDSLSEFNEIIYVEKPKRLFFGITTGISVSCITAVQNAGFNLFGEGVLVAIIDSGIDYSHPVFRNADGSTRILELWDQTIQGNPPEGYYIGSVYTKENINEALRQPTMEAMYSMVPSRDLSGHGTHVAGIAAGNFAQNKMNNQGIATKSELLIVKLGNPAAGGFPRTTELMQAIDYVVKKAIEYNRPVAINISFGNTYGSHDGTSLVETFINSLSEEGRTVIVVASGNEGAAAGHTSGMLREGVREEVELAIGSYEQSLSVQIWKAYYDLFDIEIENPSRDRAVVLYNNLGPQRFNIQNTQLLIYYGEPSPYSQFQEIYIDFIPRGDYIDTGIWKITLVPRRIVNGRYDMWLPSEAVLNVQTKFLRPTPDTTLTIPSTSEKVITVGAYNPATQAYAEFSGRGFTRMTNQVKPDLSAPGVNILSAVPGGGFDTKSGTSMAAPFVTGSAALMMQWGIVNGNDPFLYGEKAKAYFIRGARHFPGETVWPNPRFGYGALCLRDSIPI